MNGLKMLLPSMVDFYVPTMLIGTSLKDNDKTHFAKIMDKINFYMNNFMSNVNLVNILDVIENSKKVGMSQSVPILAEVVKILRVHLLSTDPDKVYKTIFLLDVIIKNSGYRMHILLGRRKFMQTFGIVLRRHRAKVNSSLHQRVSSFAIDCIQAWGEAFTSRRSLYPHIYETYYKMRYKYHIRFPRMDFDPTRVPIFLGEVTDRERQLAQEFPDDEGDSSSSVYTDDFEETKEPTGSELGESYSSRSNASRASSFNQYSSREQFRSGGGGTYAIPERPANAIRSDSSSSLPSEYSSLPKVAPRLSYHEPLPVTSSAKQSPSLARMKQRGVSSLQGTSGGVVGDGDSLLLDLDFEVVEREDVLPLQSSSHDQVEELSKAFNSVAVNEPVALCSQQGSPSTAPPPMPDTVPWYSPPPVPIIANNQQATPPFPSGTQIEQSVMSSPSRLPVPVMLSTSSNQFHTSQHFQQQSSFPGGQLQQLQVTPYTGPVPAFSLSPQTSSTGAIYTNSAYTYRGRDTFAVVTPPKTTNLGQHTAADTSFAALDDEVHKMKSQLSVRVSGTSGVVSKKEVAVVSPDRRSRQGSMDDFEFVDKGQVVSPPSQQESVIDAHQLRSRSQSTHAGSVAYSSSPISLRNTNSALLLSPPIAATDSESPTTGADGRVRSGTYYNQQQALRKQRSEFVPPSSDPSVQIRFFGNQRIVVKKPSSVVTGVDVVGAGGEGEGR